MKLAVKIDQVATLRQARENREPDPVSAAVLAELSGADAIAVHRNCRAPTPLRCICVRIAAIFRNVT